MMMSYPFDAELLRAEIAAAAARMIAEDGADYASAKRKAAKNILGDARVRGAILPDNAQIEEEVRLYNEIFFSDRQPARLLQLRRLALQWMESLIRFNPYLTGAVLNGTAGEHSELHLQLFADSPKDVEIELLNRNINFDVTETSHFKGHGKPVETVSFLWKNEGIHLALYEHDDLRGALKTRAGGKMERADIDTVRKLIDEHDKNNESPAT